MCGLWWGEDGIWTDTRALAVHIDLKDMYTFNAVGDWICTLKIKRKCKTKERKWRVEGREVVV